MLDGGSRLKLGRTTGDDHSALTQSCIYENKNRQQRQEKPKQNADQGQEISGRQGPGAAQCRLVVLDQANRPGLRTPSRPGLAWNGPTTDA